MKYSGGIPEWGSYEKLRKRIIPYISWSKNEMNLSPKRGLRRIIYNGHQLYWEGYFHGWTKSNDGKMKAIIEHTDGSIHLEDMIYCLKFYDLEEQ
jgi:hypothetical protein